MPVSTALEEAQFYDEFIKAPHNYAHVMAARNKGLVTKNSRGRKVRELAKLLDDSLYRAIHFDYDAQEYRVSDEYTRRDYTYGVHNNNSQWANSIVYRAPINGAVQTDSDAILRRVTKEQVNLLYGIELEMYKTSTKVVNSQYGGLMREVCDVFGGINDAACKYDGSIGEEGFELVTIPLTEFEMRKRLLKFTSCGVTDKLTTTDSCGVHIHVSRIPFTFLATAKLMHFCHARGNRSFICDIGGRDPDEEEYCVFNSYAGGMPPHKIVSGNYFGEFTDHFCAVSINDSKPTFEFRIYTGTVDKLRLMTYFEFTAAICEYVLNHSGTGLNTLSYKDFVQWLTDPYYKRLKEKNRVYSKAKGTKLTKFKHPRYPYLYTTLVNLGYIKD